MFLFCSISAAKVLTIFDMAKNNFHNHTEPQRGRTAKIQTPPKSSTAEPETDPRSGHSHFHGFSRSIQGAFTDKIRHIDGARK